jgi:hypothetical protein
MWQTRFAKGRERRVNDDWNAACNQDEENCQTIDWYTKFCTGTEQGSFSTLSEWWNHRVHILVEMKQGQCICPLSWSVHCNFTGEDKCNERGWACTPHPHQPGLILPSSLNIRQKAAVSTLCTLWVEQSF